MCIVVVCSPYHSRMLLGVSDATYSCCSSGIVGDYNSSMCDAPLRVLKVARRAVMYASDAACATLVVLCALQHCLSS
jgi:hypothetical protein